MKISSFIISILLVGLIVTSFGAFYADVGIDYGVVYPDEANNTFSAYNQFATIENTTSELNNTIFGSDQESSGVTDLVGKFLGSGFIALKTATQSFSAFYSILSESASALHLPSFFLPTLSLIVLVIVLFIIVSALVGRDL